MCYVDKVEPRKQSVALDLKDVERYEFYAGFLKSSPKVTLIPKASKRFPLQSRSPAPGSSFTKSVAALPASRPDSPYRASPVNPAPTHSATWVCTICTFSNPVPSNFDPATANAHTPLPPCLACGIKPTLAHVLKAAITNATNRAPTLTGQSLQNPIPVRPRPAPSEVSDVSTGSGTAASTPPPLQPDTADPGASFQCPRCTFLNHPSLMVCEICGAPLISQNVPVELRQPQERTDSPGPFLGGGVSGPGLTSDTPESVKISFRSGGAQIFYERLKGAMTQRKWLLQGAPPIPKTLRAGDTGSASASWNGAGGGSASPVDRVKTAGIAGLEQRGLDRRKNNEIVIGTAFEDLEALMASAKEIVALAESFAKRTNGGKNNARDNALLAESAAELGLITTKDIVGGADESLYLSELARNLAEFLTDDSRGVLRKAGGIISLVDLWAMFNRVRGGVELVSPHDFEKAVRLWEKLKLPIRLRTFRSGVLVVQSRDRTDETTIKSILAWMRDLHEFPPDHEVPWDWREFGRGVTAQDAAERFGWSIGVAEEELEMAEERGRLCREEGIEGLKFWENYIDTGEGRSYRSPEQQEEERLKKALKEAGFV